MAVDYATLKKGGFMRQKQKNNFSLRLRVVGGNLTAVQLAKIAEVAEKYGDGHVHLTSRQSVEIPFIKLEQVEDVKAALAEGGVEPGVCGPRVRTITACQGEAICPSGCIDTYSLAKELDDRYFARELPHKFKFGMRNIPETWRSVLPLLILPSFWWTHHRAYWCRPDGTPESAA